MTVDEALALVRQILAPKRLSKIQELILRQAWEGKSYFEIGKSSGYDAAYIKDEGYKLWQLLSQVAEMKVTKNNFPTVLAQYATRLQMHSNPEADQPISQTHIDWGEAIDVSTFYGRTAELETLSHWLLTERCRLVAILGMGGMGKTALSVKLAQQVQSEFQFVIWRSLRDEPPLSELLTTLLQFLAKDQESLPETEAGKLTRLLDVLRTARCLLILDNFEALFQAGERTGTYQHGYEGYQTLLQRLAQGQHQSCVVLTSREKPAVVGALQGESLAVRVLPLSGLPLEAGQDLLEAKGLSGSEAEINTLVRAYHGNPLALMITATSIQDVYAGKISSFLRQQATVFSGVRELLHQQFARLADVETKIMYWLAISREPVSVEELQADIVPFVAPAQLVEALESLAWRSLIERNADGFTQQPVIMEYVTEKLLDGMRQDIASSTYQNLEQNKSTDTISLSFLKHYALLKTTAKDYIRESQIRLIVNPLIEQTTALLGNTPQLIKQLKQMLSQLRHNHPMAPGYAAGNLINLLGQLRADLTGADFSGLTIWQADLTHVNLHSVNLAQADLSKSIFAETFGGVLSVAFSPDGQLLATSDTSGCIQVWHTVTGKQLQTIDAHVAWLWAVAFSPDGKTIASCSDDTTIKLWDGQTSRCLQVLTGASITYTVAFSPDGRWLASGGGDGMIKLWQLDTLSAPSPSFTVLEGHQGWIWSVAFSLDSQSLISASADHTIKIWDLATGSCTQTLQGHTDWVRSVAFSPDGQQIISGSSDRSVKLWNVKTGRCLTTFQGHQDTVTALAFHANGQHVASASYDQTVKLWDLASGDCLRTLQAHDNRVWSVAFSPNGHQLVSGGDDHAARLWELRTGRCSKAWRGHTNAAMSLSFQATHSVLASGHEDENIRLWNIKTGKIIKVLRGHTHRVWSVAFSPASAQNENLLASSSGDRTVKLWNWQTEECLFTFKGHKSWIWSIAFSPDGNLLASSSVDGLVKLWNVHTGECIHTLEGHVGASVGTTFSADGQQLASGGFDRTIKIWDTSTGQRLQTLQGHQNFVWSVLFYSNNQLISSSYDHTIKFWDLTNGSCTRTLQGHNGPVLGLALSADGQYLASGSLDQTIKLWKLDTDECMQTLTGHRGLVVSLLFCPAYEWLPSRRSLPEILVSGSFDETIKLWDIKTGSCLQTLHPPRPYERMNITGVTGITDAQRATLKALGAHD